ncbi:MAG: hypothetical protein HQ548_06895, partial [Chloroflexi bacterium]|nr:hypothetical protein [Chloroflexota bacterium]
MSFVEETRVASAAPPYDFGDAPDPTYPSLLASNGARHADSTQLWLGESADVEAESKQIDADFSDDGIQGTSPLKVKIQRSPSYGGSAYLNVLVDWNRDGDWADASPPERAVADQPVAFTGPDPNIAIIELTGLNVPANTWVRLTVTGSTIGATYIGSSATEFAIGETEDHKTAPEHTAQQSQLHDPITSGNHDASASFYHDPATSTNPAPATAL